MAERFYGAVLMFGLALLSIGPARMSHAEGSRRDAVNAGALVVRSGGNVRGVLEVLVPAFERQAGVRVRYSAGGSGQMLSAALETKDTDVCLAADLRHVRRAEHEGVVAAKLPLVVLWPTIVVKKGNPKGIAGLEDLRRAGMRVYLESPEGCQLGTATEQLLRKNNLEISTPDVSLDGRRPTLRTVVPFLEAGALDATIVWDCTARQLADKVDAIAIPRAQNVRVNLVGIVFRFAREPRLAEQFLRFLRDDVSRLDWQKHGFTPAQGSGRARLTGEAAKLRQAAERMIRASRTVLGPVYAPLAEHLTRKLRLGDKEGIGIDVGSGPGTLIVELCARTRLHWVNADINPHFFPHFYALARARGVGHRVSAVCADAQDLPFRSDYADVVVSRGSYHFWEKRRAGFREIYRVLKPGGVAYIGRGFSANLPVETARKIRGKQRPHFQYDPAKEGNDLRALLHGLGVRDVRVHVPKPAGSEGINYGVWVEFQKPARRGH